MLRGLYSLVWAALLLVVASTAPVIAAEGNSYRPMVVGEGAITASAGEDETLTFTVLYRNTASDPVRISIIAPEGETKLKLNFSVQPNPVAPGQFTPLKVTVSGADLSKLAYVDVRGMDIVNNELVSSDVRSVKLPADYFTLASYFILGLAFVFAVAIAFAAWRKLEKEQLTDEDVALPNLDITKSWTSNITVAGALLTAALAGVLPEAPHYMVKATYLGLSLIFAISVAAAPMAFLCLEYFPKKKPQQPAGEAEKKDDKPAAIGSVSSYVVSNAITIFAVVGQLLTLIVVLDEVRRGNAGTGLLLVAEIGLGLLILGDLRYAYASIVTTVEGAEETLMFPVNAEPSEDRPDWTHFDMLTIQGRKPRAQIQLGNRRPVRWSPL